MLRAALAFALLGLAPLASAAACSDSGASPGSGGAAASGSGGEGGLQGDVSCVADARIDTYTAKLEKPGDGGVLTFVLASSNPAPPAKGANTFQIVVRDQGGAARTGVLTADPFMPDHGHGTSVTPIVTFDEASGAYTIDPLYLFMPGVWRIRLSFYDASASDPPVDQADFFFCVEG